MSEPLDVARQRIHEARSEGEGPRVRALLHEWRPQDRLKTQIHDQAVTLIEQVRGQGSPNLLEAFLAEYGLSTDEGVAMMCLAEALLRVPDSPTIDALIEDKIVPGRWGRHLNRSSSSLVNASTWALMLTGRLLSPTQASSMVDTLRSAVKRIGEPAVRAIIAEAMKELGRQFVLGRHIDEALERSAPAHRKGYTFSYDMLGEAARCEADARRYHLSYSEAISALAPGCASTPVRDNPGISVKLSALHPRFEHGQRQRVLDELLGRVAALAQLARSAGMGFNIDAEESERLDLTLDIIEALICDSSLADWDGFGVVVQAYQLGAGAVIDWLHCLAQRHRRRIMVRLVKGAYWDTEIKRAQVLGLAGYPVFTRKASTDLSYISCAKKLLDGRAYFYPQFATHNAHTVSAVMALSGGPGDSFEFQRLHGMGESLFSHVGEEGGYRCRIYAPVGAHKDLLAYLVRRLLENGANSSFVNQILDHEIDAGDVARDPLDEVRSVAKNPAHPAIRLPPELFAPQRVNSRGWDLEEGVCVSTLEKQMKPFVQGQWDLAGAQPDTLSGPLRQVQNPAVLDDLVGLVREAAPEDVPGALVKAQEGARTWGKRSPGERANVLCRAADLYERHAPELIALAAREAGKTLADGVAEVREAVDFLRYYAGQINGLGKAQPRGTFVCISPWNFPLAIFTGQVSAALAGGNAVIAKPAEQSALMAVRASALLHEAGVPDNALQCLPGDGAGVGGALVQSSQVSGVCFTGSTQTARNIQCALATAGNPDAALIAETGGLNAMLVDSTALPEQAVRDIVVSAFQSAGQRCSALRILYLQNEVRDRVLELLFGAMDELHLGNPLDLATDVGPLIDFAALENIRAYCAHQQTKGRVLKQLSAPAGGHFMAPTVIEVGGIEDLEHEVFGPVLHVATYPADELQAVVRAINQRGYGLTLGVHTRVDARVQQVIDQAHVGNIYVNRNQIGAVVGSQPFGGEGLSGTGPKAGGPHYLPRFVERGRVLCSMKQGRGAQVALEQINDWASTQGQSPGPLDPRLAKRMLESAGACLSAQAADEIEKVAHDSLELPGPTGESNRWTLYPRGNVLCLGPHAKSLRSQACQALALGNRVLAIGTDTTLLEPLRTDWPLEVITAIVEPDTLEGLSAINAIMLWLSGEALRPWRRALAQCDGPIIPLINEPGASQCLVIERHVCADTTASGGNTALLVQSA